MAQSQKVAQSSSLEPQSVPPVPVPFREIVLASHLKPLEKKDRLGQRRNVLWNPCAAPAETAPTHAVEIPQVREKLLGPHPQLEMAQEWCVKWDAGVTQDSLWV